MVSTDELDLSAMNPKQLRNVCTARGMTPASWDIKKLISQIESVAPALNDNFFEQSIAHARHTSGSVNAAPTLSDVTDQNNSKVSSAKVLALYCVVFLPCQTKNIFIMFCFFYLR
jgi:hypothetical protein